MRRKVLIYYFIISIIIGTAIYFAQKRAFNLPSFINNYVNDFLIVPIVLIISLWIYRASKEDFKYEFPFWIVFYMSSFYSVVFEYFLPTFNQRYTADFVDVILYYTSGFLFYYLQKIK